MDKKLNEIKEKVKKLNKMIEASCEDIEEEPPTTLDKEIVNNYEDIWKEVLKISQENKIKDMDKFDEEYQIFQFGLEYFIDSYSDFIDYCTQMDKIFLEPEIKMLKEVIKQFNLEEDKKQEYELLIIRDIYLTGKKEEAEKQIEKWIKKNPTIGEGYEVKCDWELEKEKPNMEKIAEVLNEAEENNTFVPNEEIYEQVIKYYEKIGNDEMAQYYDSLLEFYDEKNYDFEGDEEDIFLQEQEELISEIKKKANDKVKKGKKFEEYLFDKSEEELMLFLGPQVIMNSQEELQIIKKDIKQYVLKNYKEIIKENMKYMPKYIIEIIKHTPSNGILEKKLEPSSMEELFEITKYFLLQQYGMAFIGHENEKITIIVPCIKEMKENLRDSNFVKENNEFNEKKDVIIGICEVHGAIKIKKVYNIMEKFYGECNKERFAKFLIIVCKIFENTGIKIDKKTGFLQYIYHNLIDEKIAKEIINENKDICTYTKEEYIKYSSYDFIYNTKGYKKLEKELESAIFYGEDLIKMLENILIPYSIETRLKEENANKIVELLVEELKEMEQIGLGVVNIKKVKEGFKELAEELPRWRI